MADLVSQGINDYMTIRTSQKMQTFEENQRSYDDYCRSLSQNQSLSEPQRGEQRVNFRLEQMKDENITLTIVKNGLDNYILRTQ